MHRSWLRLADRWLLSSLVLLATTGSASANYFELLRRVPDSANMVILIDVERMLMSPIAMREKWRDKANSPEAGTLHFPINAERYLLASKLNFVSNFEDLWDVAMIETINAVSLPQLSKTEGGYLDTVEGKQVAFSPRNAFFVLFEPTILGVSFPANRQDLGRWLRTLQRFKEPQVSKYLRDAVTLAHGKDHMVVAFDLEDLFTSRMMRDKLHSAESLAGKQVDLDALTKVLTSIKGVTITMEAAGRLNGKLRIDFGESPAPLKGVAKPLMFEVLENQGMMLDEIKEWRLIFETKAITLEGRMTTKGLRKLTDLIPFPAETLDLQKAEPRAGGAPTESASPPSTQDRAVTSKKYFEHIRLVLEQLRSDLKAPTTSPKVAQRLVHKAAQEIDRLSVLNVDEELMAYGTGVSETLRNVRNLAKTASLDASFRQATAAGNQGYGYGYGGFYGGTSLALSTSVMRKQESAVLQANELAVITMLEQKTAEIRKKMTLKYQTPF
jgi:hypothetical protein